MVSKRLAQCLEPELPAGVHQKALEVYTAVFSSIKPEGLANELMVWSPGLVPLLSFCSMQTRGHLLNIYEQFYITLGGQLRPILRSLILALMPTLEEENSESFSRCLELLQKFREAVNDDEYFWQCFWLANIISPGRRIGGLSWLSRRMPNFDDPEPIFAASPDPGLMLRCFCQGLRDSELLVQRGYLELLVQNIRINCDFLLQVSQKNRQMLFECALLVVLRKDMSLNRRLYTWLLPNDDEKVLQAVVLNDIITVIEGMLGNDFQRACRVLLSLLEKPQIARIIMPRIIRVFLYKICDVQISPVSANMLYNALSPKLLWKTVLESVSAGDVVPLQFILSNQTLREEDIVVHLPLMFFGLCLKQPDNWDRAAMKIAEVLSRQSPVVAETDQPKDSSNVKHSLAWAEALYSNDDEILSTEAVDYSVVLLVQKLLHEVKIGELQVLSSLLSVRKYEYVNDAEVFCILEKLLKLEDLPFEHLIECNKVFLCYPSQHHVDSSQLQECIVQKFWLCMINDSSTHQVEAVDHLWELQTMRGDLSLSASICSILSKDTTYQNVKGVLNLWTLSSNRDGFEKVLRRPVCFLLSLGIEHRAQSSHVLHSGIRSLSSQPHLFHILLCEISDSEFLFNNLVKTTRHGIEYEICRLSEEEDVPLLTHSLRLLINVLEHCTRDTFASFQTNALAGVPGKWEKLGLDSVSFENLFGMIAIRCFRFCCTDSEDFALYSAALEILKLLTSLCPPNRLASLRIGEEMLINLVVCDPGNAQLQSMILDVLFLGLNIQSESSLGSGVNTKRERTSGDDMLTSHSTGSASLFMQCLFDGFSNKLRRPALEAWVTFLSKCLPLMRGSLFQPLLPLTECLCDEIRTELDVCHRMFSTSSENAKTSDGTMIALLDALEHLLSTSHAQLLSDETATEIKSPPEGSGFLGNVINGVFSLELPQNRNATANNRFTVVLCFQDAIKAAFDVWSWSDWSQGSVPPLMEQSFAYFSSRIKNRARRLLEHIYLAETLESLETLMEIWKELPLHGKSRDKPSASSVFRLTKVLDGSRPRRTVPFIFDSIHSRTSAMGMEQSRKSTQTVDLGAVDVVTFLQKYVSSLELVAVEEIWEDSMSFLLDILSNVTIYRRVLPGLLAYGTVLCEKVQETAFGDSKKVRRTGMDVCQRLLTNSLTAARRDSEEQTENLQLAGTARDLREWLALNIPKLPIVLQDSVSVAYGNIMSNLVSPALHSRQFPFIPDDVLQIYAVIVGQPGTDKTWRKDTMEAFYDARFFSMSAQDALRVEWRTIVSRLMTDKTGIGELIGRISSGSTMFGSREQELSNRRLNIHRTAYVLLVCEYEAIVREAKELVGSVAEMLAGRFEDRGRGDVYVLLRVMMLRIPGSELFSLWTLVYTDLQMILHAILDDRVETADTRRTVYEASKLLDLLFVLGSDDLEL